MNKREKINLILDAWEKEMDMESLLDFYRTHQKKLLSAMKREKLQRCFDSIFSGQDSEEN